MVFEVASSRSIILFPKVFKGGTRHGAEPRKLMDMSVYANISADPVLKGLAQCLKLLLL